MAQDPTDNELQQDQPDNIEPTNQPIDEPVNKRDIGWTSSDDISR